MQSLTAVSLNPGLTLGPTASRSPGTGLTALVVGSRSSAGSIPVGQLARLNVRGVSDV